MGTCLLSLEYCIYSYYAGSLYHIWSACCNSLCSPRCTFSGSAYGDYVYNWHGGGVCSVYDVAYMPCDAIMPVEYAVCIYSFYIGDLYTCLPGCTLYMYFNRPSACPLFYALELVYLVYAWVCYPSLYLPAFFLSLPLP